jgi:hypothetical protein
VNLPHAQTSGFAGSLGMLSFPPRFELTVSAVFDEQARVGLGSLRGRRATLRSSFEPALQPAMITTMGRSGSTVLARVLEAHPQIVAYRPLEYEPRVSSYWIEMMRTLAEPASYRLQIVHGSGAPGWWLGADQGAPARRGDTEMLDWMGSAGVEALAGFCQSRIEAFYARHAEREGRADAVYFAEKFFLPHVGPLMRELYPGAREIVLVRDFRDMIASMLAYDAKRGARGLAAGNFRSEADFVRRIGGSVERFLALWERRGDGAHLLRYEDLIQNPQETIAALLDHLQLEAGEQVRERMVSTIFEDRPEVLLHRTTGARDASIGRWRTDLDEELQRTCHEVLGPALESFGYPR